MTTRTKTMLTLILLAGAPAARLVAAVDAANETSLAPLRTLGAPRMATPRPLSASAADDQDPPAEPPARPGPAPRARKATPAPGTEAPETEEAPKSSSGSLANVKVDVTISEQRGSQPPLSKTVSMTVKDGGDGSVRSLSRRSVPSGIVVAPLNVDVRARIERQRIHLKLSLQYHVIEDVPESKNTPPLSELSQSIQVVLENGKPLVLSQSADPLSERKVTVEVKATILP